MLAPALTFVLLMLSAHRFNSLGKFMWTVVIGMLIAFVLMFVGIYMRL